MKKIVISVLAGLIFLSVYSVIAHQNTIFEKINIGNKSYCVPKDKLIKSDQLGLYVIKSKSSMLMEISQSEIKNKLGLKDFENQFGITLSVASKKENYNEHFFDDLFERKGIFKDLVVGDNMLFGLLKNFESKGSLFWHLTKENTSSIDGYIASCIGSKDSFSCNRKLYYDDIFIEYDLHGNNIQFWKEIDALTIKLLDSFECKG